jgi:hypothetical protein
MNGTATPTLPASVDEWLATLASVPSALGALLRPSWDEQLERGYGHTLREIGQQPLTWLETAARMLGFAPVLEACLDCSVAVVLTGF